MTTSLFQQAAVEALVRAPSTELEVTRRKTPGTTNLWGIEVPVDPSPQEADVASVVMTAAEVRIRQLRMSYGELVDASLGTKGSLAELVEAGNNAITEHERMIRDTTILTQQLIESLDMAQTQLDDARVAKAKSAEDKAAATEAWESSVAKSQQPFSEISVQLENLLSIRPRSEFEVEEQIQEIDDVVAVLQARLRVPQENEAGMLAQFLDELRLRRALAEITGVDASNAETLAESEAHHAAVDAETEAFLLNLGDGKDNSAAAQLLVAKLHDQLSGDRKHAAGHDRGLLREIVEAIKDVRQRRRAASDPRIDALHPPSITGTVVKEIES